jgi:hypothetical protein
MKQLMAVLAATALMTACASSRSSNPGPADVQVSLSQAAITSTGGLYPAGLVNVQYQITVVNPTNNTLTLKRLDLQSVGLGAYSIRTGPTPMHETIVANGISTIGLSAWANARGGYLIKNEPVTLRGTATFDDGHGHTFTSLFTDTMSEFGRS